MHQQVLETRRLSSNDQGNILHELGSGDSSVVRASDSWSKGPGFESRQERRENFLLQGQLPVLTLTRVTAVARKRSRSFCQKCRLQVTAKHTHTLPIWLPSDTVTWCMVECCTQNLRRNGSISRGTSDATSTERYQYTTSVDINNTRYKRIQSLIHNRMPMCAVSLLESREQRYIKAMNNNLPDDIV